MAHVESIGQNLQTQVGPKLDPQVVEALRHGNVNEILRTYGVNRADLEEYLAGQSLAFQNQILQEYQVYSDFGTVDAPVLENFPVHAKSMFLDSGDHQFFRQEMQMLNAYQPEISGTEGGKPKVQFKGMMMAKALGTEAEGPGQDVARIGEKAVQEWGDFFSELQGRVIDAQMVREMRTRTADLNRETQRIISLVMSGQVDPEYALIAAAKSNMLQNGILFSWKGKKIMHLNEEMDKTSKELLKMDPGKDVFGYQKEMQKTQAKTRSGSTQMQMELMDIQKFSQNVATTLDWVSNAIRMLAQMRQTPTQAVAAR